MFYYKKNIGDYYKKTGRLSMLEHGAYTLLIDSCYDRERFPTLDDALDWTWSRSEAEIEAVKFVLSKFFTLDGEIYVQQRIKDELDAYHAMSERNSEIAKDREEKRKDRKRNEHGSCTSGEPNVNEPPPNQEPRTKNQEPIYKQDKPVKFVFKNELEKLGADKQLVSDWIVVRIGKKAASTKTALDGFISQVEKSGLPLNTVLKICVDNSWSGFKQPWLSNINLSDYQEKQEEATQVKYEVELVNF